MITAIGAACESHREFWVAFENLDLEFWRFAIFPESGARFNAIAESASIGTVAAFERARNADEFRFDKFAGSVNHRVAMTPHVDERNVRRQVGIGKRSGLRDIAGLQVFETRPHPVPHEQI